MQQRAWLLLLLAVAAAAASTATPLPAAVTRPLSILRPLRKCWRRGRRLENETKGEERREGVDAGTARQRGVSVGESRSGEREGAREMGVRRNVRLDVLLAIARTISHSALFCAHVRTTGQRNNPGMQAQVLPLTQHLIGSDFQPHVRCMNMACLAMYWG